MELSIQYKELSSLIRNFTTKKDEKGNETCLMVRFSKARGQNNVLMVSYELDLGFVAQTVQVGLSLIGQNENVLQLKVTTPSNESAGLVKAFDGIVDYAQRALRLPIQAQGSGLLSINLPEALKTILDQMLQSDVKSGKLKGDAIEKKKDDNKSIVALVNPRFSVVKGMLCDESGLQLVVDFI